jgi:hypothetical protein
MAWVSARHAEESAQLGDTRQALASWARAEEAYSIADPEEDRAGTRFLTQDRFDSFQIATFSRIGKLDEAQETAMKLLACLSEIDRKRTVIIFGDMAKAHLAHGSLSEASKLAKNGVIALRETGFAIWMPKYEAIAQMLLQHGRQPVARAYLEELAVTKRQFASQR